MEKANQRKTPLFAEVTVGKEDRGEEKNRRQKGHPLPYVKLTYPNGVSLTLPTDICTEQLERFIRIKV